MLIVCSVLVVSLKTTMEKTRYNVRNFSDGRTHFVVVWRKILFVSLVMDRHCFVLILYPLYLYFVTIPFAFCENYLPPQIRHTHLPKLGTRVHLIWKDEAFTEMNFTPVFLFVMYIYVANVSSLIKLSLLLFWKVLHFPKFNRTLNKSLHISNFPLYFAQTTDVFLCCCLYHTPEGLSHVKNILLMIWLIKQHHSYISLPPLAVATHFSIMDI